MKYVLAILTLTLMSCSHFRSEPSKSEIEKEKLLDIHSVYSGKGYEEALKAYRDFQKSYPHSIYLQSAKLGEAKSLIALDEYSGAATLLREVAKDSISLQPALSAEAYYELGQVGEFLGDDLQAVTAYLDAKRLGLHLAPWILYAEIPGKLAAIYGRNGRQSEAISYLNDAEKGIEKVKMLDGKTLPKNWIDKSHLSMGSVATSQLSIDNFSDVVNGQSLVQIYLFRALSSKDSEVSKAAYEKIIRTYRDLYNIFMTDKNPQTQVQNGAEFLNLLEKAELFRSLEGLKSVPYEAELFNSLDNIKKEISNIVYSIKEQNPLTLESENLNRFNRAGQVHVDTYLPEEQNSEAYVLPPKEVSKEDPNL